MTGEHDKEPSGWSADKIATLITAVLAIVTFALGLTKDSSLRHNVGLILVFSAGAGFLYIVIRTFRALFGHSARATGALLLVSIALALGGGIYLLLPPHMFMETAGSEANTWSNYRNAGGIQGPTVHKGMTVKASCRIKGHDVGNGNTWWYRIASSTWDNKYFVSADNFFNNGQTAGDFTKTPKVDLAVPVCQPPAG